MSLEHSRVIIFYSSFFIILIVNSLLKADILIDYEQKSAQELLYQVRNDSEDENYRRSQEMEEKYEN
jgi:hypothetical protein